MDLDRVIRKAKQSGCRYKVCAVGFDKRGELLGYATNRPRFNKYGGSIHAELALISRYGRALRSLVLCRVGRGGALMSIRPCKVCERVLLALKISWKTLRE